MRGWLVLALVTGWAGSGWAEGRCFRTVPQAAVQVGELAEGGFRLEFARLDAFGGRGWAYVRSCAHPEWPLVAVRAGAAASTAEGSPVARMAIAVARTNAVVMPVVKIGRAVRVMRQDAMARLEVGGVVQNDGAVGDSVWVRLVSEENGGQGRMVQAIVRSAELLEMN
jgi:hypothetical protein